MDICKEIICGKDVYFFESHHYALLPWAKLKRRCSNDDIYLISFDHHTDIIEPFLRYSYSKKKEEATDVLEEEPMDVSEEEATDVSEEEPIDSVDKIDFRGEATIKGAIKNLKNDEHIRTAIESKIIKSAYIVSHEGKESPESIQEKEKREKLNNPEFIFQLYSGNVKITPLAERNYPEADIHMASFMPEGVYECGDEYDDVILEDAFLQEKMFVFSRMTPKVISANGIIQGKYILDIDLDYFHTVKAIEPKDYTIFANLVTNAEIITVAEEPICVELLRSDSEVTSNLLKAKLLELIKGILENQ